MGSRFLCDNCVSKADHGCYRIIFRTVFSPKTSASSPSFSFYGICTPLPCLGLVAGTPCRDGAKQLDRSGNRRLVYAGELVGRGSRCRSGRGYRKRRHRRSVVGERCRTPSGDQRRKRLSGFRWGGLGSGPVARRIRFKRLHARYRNGNGGYDLPGARCLPPHRNKRFGDIDDR